MKEIKVQIVTSCSTCIFYKHKYRSNICVCPAFSKPNELSDSMWEIKNGIDSACPLPNSFDIIVKHAKVFNVPELINILVSKEL